MVIRDLVAEINQADSQLLNYYISTKVSFSGGETVNFNNQDEQNIYTTLAKRIYSTRNAILHSKEGMSKETGKKNKYTPFIDDHVLSKELPLMQLISEQIILSTSDEFKL
ncbi:hypothetical protein [Cylindrospermum stagnale]|uniref:hypothetical protein n=1 Tax=Cylindrospermum stagnale TaxID=142864 RepID=UPI0012F693A8|nr:hypothetical protein [Cylindrospermum stagnale]